MKIIVVWYNPKLKEYYYKYVTGMYGEVEIGFKNNYNHEIVLIIKPWEFLEKKKTPNIKKRFINRLIRLLNKWK